MKTHLLCNITKVLKTICCKLQAENEKQRQ